MAHRVLLVDHQKLIRDGIKAILEGTGEFTVVGEAGNGWDALQFAKKSDVDLVVLEIALPGLDGSELTRELVRHCSGSRVVILSSCDDEDTVMAALQCGVRGYLLKQDSAGELLEALRTVARGGSHFSARVYDHLVARIRRGDLADDFGASRSKKLTPRELEVLRLITAGHSSTQIAHMLSLSVATVRSYRKTMMRKLGVNHIAALIQLAVREGLTGWTHRGPGGYT